MRCTWTDERVCSFSAELFLSRDVWWQAGGRLFFNDEALGVFDWSQHLCFRSHGSEAKKEQCVPGSGTDKPQPCQHTSSIHAGSPSIIHTLQQAHAFQTHYQSRDYVLKRDAAAAAIEHPSAPGVYIHKQARLASHFSTTVSSLLLWPLLPWCLCAATRHGTLFGSQLPDTLLPAATSDLTGEVSLDRYEHSFAHCIFFSSRFVSSVCSGCDFF